MWRHLLIQEAVSIDAVNRIRAYLAAFNEGMNGIHQVKPFILQVVCRCCRKHQERVTRMAIGHKWHLNIQVLAKPGCGSTFHVNPSGKYPKIKDKRTQFSVSFGQCEIFS